MEPEEKDLEAERNGNPEEGNSDVKGGETEEGNNDVKGGETEEGASETPGSVPGEENAPTKEGVPMEEEEEEEEVVEGEEVVGGDDEPGMWEETFKSYHDSKPHGEFSSGRMTGVFSLYLPSLYAVIDTMYI